ncbi:bifunctional 2-polyprenyl-6-hydroxyphenol methylase/3-demethylubiquinol 3-O-methyltransferase UbiG [Virgibacillus sp. SK37]|uniref:class I SAM-dependent methyltransferase n=1 Tax=Virgibacillus sp. SK37 TaxID=403957 RepID=UPI0004D16B3D|nr:class I SAM-dependent methyltransferase [Virgibacillus sp. SK37]AIF42351.1 methyltransferase [Virgibacillus sp. SK37]
MKSFNWEKEAETQWDQRAAFWNARSKKMWDSGSRKDIVDFIKKHIPEDYDMLDVGCGDGYGSFKLTQAGYKVTGVDISSEMIELAKKNNKNAAAFYQADINQLPFKADTFHGAVGINVLEWTENPVSALNEMKRIVKKDGYLCVGILGPTAGPRENSFPRLYGENAICNTMMPWEFQRIAQEKNLEYIDGFGVYKEGVNEENYSNLSLDLKQALTFMWVFIFRKAGDL